MLLRVPRRLAVPITTVVMGIALLSPTPRVAEAQSTCANSGVLGETTINAPIDTAGTCSIEGLPSDPIVSDGTFIKNGTPMTLHAVADATGMCTLRSWSYWPIMCVAYGEQLRAVAKVSVVEAPPTLVQAIHSIYPVTSTGYLDYTRQHMNTRDTGTTFPGPLRYSSFAELGEWRWQVQSIIHVTNCNLLPDRSELIERRINISNCLPKWWNVNYPPDGPVVTPHVPPTVISVYVGMPGLIQPTSDAIDDWNPRVAGTGTQYERVENPCSGPACVMVQEGTISKGCAETRIPYGPDGVATDTVTITFPPDWTSRTYERNRRTMAHELGHPLGLDENAACPPNETVMWPPVIQQPSDCLIQPPGPLSPTAHDGAQARATYQPDKNSARKACGF